MKQDLIDRIKAFDAYVGPNLDVYGYKALSMVERDHLRSFFQEAGYERVRSDPCQKTPEYPMDSTNVYSCVAKQGIDIFVERNLGTREHGFSYVRLPTMESYQQFQKMYQRILTTPMPYRITEGLIAWSSLPAGIAGGMMCSSFLAGLLVFCAVGTCGLGVGAIDFGKKLDEQEKMKKLSGLVCNPRQAILKAFHLPIEKEAERDAAKEGKTEKKEKQEKPMPKKRKKKKKEVQIIPLDEDTTIPPKIKEK